MALSTLKRYIIQLVNGTTIKYTKTAMANSTVASTKAYDLYLDSYYERDTFTSYSTYPYSVIEACPSIKAYCEGLSNLYKVDVDTYISTFALQPNRIPSTLKPSDSIRYKDIYDEVIKRYREYVIKNYEEGNAYYRMLIGLPAYGANEYIYVDKNVLNKHGINPTKYTFIHELTDDELFILEASGYIDELKTKYPSYKYLNYLGRHKVDLFMAHQAKNFAILQIDKEGIPENVYTSFTKIYAQCREYFMNVIYSNNLSSMHEYYDNFIALCIMVMTIQRFMTTTFKSAIERDLYDWDFIQNIYKSYNVPFIESLSIDHHMVLIKNLNNLIRHKSTDKVLFDICSLLGVTYADIYKYYLIKEQKHDDLGNPIFIYKNIYDDEGNVIDTVIDNEETYELYFQAVNIDENNVVFALQNSGEGNRVEYKTMISNDPYWWEDGDLTELKYNTAFNYIETKYLSINLMYKMTEMLFEVSYAFRLILDKKEDISNFKMSIPKIIPDENFTIFDIVVFMIALMCKQYKFTGNIQERPGLIAHIYGFNFADIFDDDGNITDYLKNKINSLDSDDAKELSSYLNNMKITSDNDIDELFETIKKYKSFIVDRMRESNDIKTYQLFRDIYNITMTENNMRELFNYTNGSGSVVTAISYVDYLNHVVPVLGNAVRTVEPDDIPGYIEHIISQLDVYVESLQYTYVIAGNDSPLLKALTILIQFFKSYTTDLSKFNVVYLFDSKLFNMLKSIDENNSMSANIQVDEDARYQYADSIHTSTIDIHDDTLNGYDIDKNIVSHISPKESFLRWNDIETTTQAAMTLFDSMHHMYSDDACIISSNLRNKDNLVMREKLSIISKDS